MVDVLMDKEVLQKAKAVSKWLKENANPHTCIEITYSGVKMKADTQFAPTIEGDLYE